MNFKSGCTKHKGGLVHVITRGQATFQFNSATTYRSTLLRQLPVVPVDLELLGPVHPLQGPETLQTGGVRATDRHQTGESKEKVVARLTSRMSPWPPRMILLDSPGHMKVLTCRGTLLDPVTNWRNFARSVWSKLLRARQNLGTGRVRARAGEQERVRGRAGEQESRRAGVEQESRRGREGELESITKGSNDPPQ